MSGAVTLPKTEYETMKRKAKAYEELAGLFFTKIKTDPVREIISDFKKTKLYSQAFLRDLKIGLERSSLRTKR